MDADYGPPGYQLMKFEVHNYKKIGAVNSKHLLKNASSCNSNSDCKWVAANCCPATAGAEWVCLNKQVKTHLCSEGPMSCNEFVSPKPSNDCICKSNTCGEK